MLVWLALSAILCCSVCARADDDRERTVAVVRGAGPPELADRLRDEMMTLGWSVVELTPPAPEDGSPIDIRAVTEAITGSAGVLVRESEVVVWVQRPTGDGTAVEETVPLAVDADASLAAMQLVELLRARLIAAGFELRAAAEQPQPSPVSTEAPARPQPPDRSQAATGDRSEDIPTGDVGDKDVDGSALHPFDPALWLGAGAGLGVSAGGVPAAPYGVIRGWLRPARRLSATLDLAIPLVGASVSEAEAHADVRPGLVMAGLDYVVVARREHARVVLGAAGGLVLVHIDGSVEPPDEAGATWIPVASLGAHAGYRHPLGRRLTLTADALIGLTAPRPVVRFYDEVAASWGRPYALLALGVALRAL